MTEKFQISKRLNDGTILVVGGDSVTEFAGNLQGIVGDEGRDAIRALFYDLIPAAAGSQPDQFVQAQQNIGQAFPQQPAPPAAGPSGPVPNCPNHQQPARWVPPGVSKATGKAYQGFFSCAVSQQGDRSCRLPR